MGSSTNCGAVLGATQPRAWAPATAVTNRTGRPLWVARTRPVIRGSNVSGEQRDSHRPADARDPSQPREIFDEAALQELVESIESLGVLQPVRVRWDEELAMYVIVSGEPGSGREDGRAKIRPMCHSGG